MRSWPTHILNRPPLPVPRAQSGLVHSDRERPQLHHGQWLHSSYHAAGRSSSVHIIEDHPDAIAALEQALSWGRSFEHTAQRLRDAHAEEQALRAEADRLRADGLPVLDRDDVPGQSWNLRLDNLVTTDGDPAPQGAWPDVAGAAVILRAQWDYPDDTDGQQDYEPVLRFVRVWICTDPEAAGLRSRHASPSPGGPAAAAAEDTEQRREVIANNKAWRSAETVRKQWLTQFVTRTCVATGA